MSNTASTVFPRSASHKHTKRGKENNVGENQLQQIRTQHTTAKPTPSCSGDSSTISTNFYEEHNYQNNGHNYYQQETDMLNLSLPADFMTPRLSIGSNSSNTWRRFGVPLFNSTIENDRRKSDTFGRSSGAACGDSYFMSSMRKVSGKNNGSSRHYYQQHRCYNQQYLGSQQRNYNTSTPKNDGRGDNNHCQQYQNTFNPHQSLGNYRSGEYKASSSNQRRHSFAYSSQDYHNSLTSPLMVISSKNDLMSNSDVNGVNGDMTPFKSPDCFETPDAGKGGLGVSGSSGFHSGTGRKLRSGGSLKHPSPLIIFGSNGKISPFYQQLVPTARTHFASSKCFDSPAPNALPKPPDHWKTAKGPTKNDQKRRRKVTGGTDSQESEDGEKDHSKGFLLNKFVNVEKPKEESVGNESTSVNKEVEDTKEPSSLLYCSSLLRSSKRNLLDDFETYNLKLMLKVQS